MRGFLQQRGALITNFNAGGLAESILESVGVSLGSDGASFPGVTATPLYASLLAVAAGAYVATASGSALDAAVSNVGLLRKNTANYANYGFAGGYATFSVATAPATPLVIPSGTVIAAETADPTQTPILYTTTASGVITTGTTSVSGIAFIAQQSGTSGNQPGGAVNTVLSGPAGIQVTNPLPTVGGLSAESDAALQARALGTLPSAAQCTPPAIVNDALAQTGITYAYVLENTNATGGVQFGVSQLYCDDGSGNLSSPANPNHGSLVALQNALTTGAYRAAGVVVQANGSVPSYLTITMNVVLSKTYLAAGGTAAAVTGAAQQAIYNAVTALPVGSRVNLDFLVEAVENAAISGLAEVVLSSVTINGSAQDFIPSYGFIAPRLLNLASVTIGVSGSE